MGVTRKLPLIRLNHPLGMFLTPASCFLHMGVCLSGFCFFSASVLLYDFYSLDFRVTFVQSRLSANL